MCIRVTQVRARMRYQLHIRPSPTWWNRRTCLIKAVYNWDTSSTLFHWLQGPTLVVWCGQTEKGCHETFLVRWNQIKYRGELQLACCVWRGRTKKPSTFIHSTQVNDSGNIGKNRFGELIVKPQAVIDYTQGMDKVDVGYQLASSHLAVRWRTAVIYKGGHVPFWHGDGQRPFALQACRWRH